MSVSKREWVAPNGEKKQAWVVRYSDGSGTRRLKTFAKKKDADVFESSTKVEVRQGTHVADSVSITIKEAGRRWIESGEAAGLERSTINQRKRHLKFHIEPLIGDTLLSKLTAPSVRDFEDRLRKEGRSPAMLKKIVVSLGSILGDSIERGLATRNPVRDVRARRKSAADKRQKRRLEVGRDIPSREEIKRIIGVLDGRWRPLMLTLIFAGLRSSEVRAMRWQDVDFERKAIHVRQRVDEFGQIGQPKSTAGTREIPVPPMLIAALKEWKLACPRRATGQLNADGEPIKELHYTFPNGVGRTESHANVWNRGVAPPQVKAGVAVATGKKDEDGNVIMKAKYSLHAFRHFYASWLINRTQDGGLGLPVKSVQQRMGHSSIMMTSDVYGHIFPRGDDAEELAAAERVLLG